MLSETKEELTMFGWKKLLRYCFWILVLVNCSFSRNVEAYGNSLHRVYLGSREGDPAGIVENVSVIHGDYSELEVDVKVPAPDPLILTRFYSSRDPLEVTNFGGWRFNAHCYLRLKKDPKGKSYSAQGNKFERVFAYVGNPEGSILTYIGWQNSTDVLCPVQFHVDPEEDVLGLVNTARSNISSWTNLKNNELKFDREKDCFELGLGSEGKRFYSKHSILDIYVLTYEILPSGNKIFYEFDDKAQLTSIQETNASEQKILAWIKIQYGEEVHVETSDLKLVDYRFKEDSLSGASLLTQVCRSDKPDLAYQYQVLENHALLKKKIFPEGRFVQVDYFSDAANAFKVQSITTPANESQTGSVQFSYEDDYTEVKAPDRGKVIYRYDDDFQLTAIEHYLDGELYRVHKKSWGLRNNAGNLIASSVEDASGNIYHYKRFKYDDLNQGNIVEEREYGDIVGTGMEPLVLDEDGLVSNCEGYVREYSYFKGKNTHGFLQADGKGAGVKYWYKKGTNLLIKKFILNKGCPNREDGDEEIVKRHFYEYDEDAVLTKIITDDGGVTVRYDDCCTKKYFYENHPTEGRITILTPKKDLPNFGAPEIIEEKYYKLVKDSSGKNKELQKKEEILFKKTINQFDEQGNIIAQEVYDSTGNLCYTLNSGYANGLLEFETDPMGQKVEFTYDENGNLTSESHASSGLITEYGYDLRNRPIYTREKNQEGNQFETRISYDLAGNVLTEIDHFGNESRFVYDDLGRRIEAQYPETSNGFHSTSSPKYKYAYDLFDHLIQVTDPNGRVLTRKYTVKGEPSEISYLDGTKEVFRYDRGGNLRHYYGRDGVLQVYEYDYEGRIKKTDYFSSKKREDGTFFKKSFYYNSFQKIEEWDQGSEKTSYTYNGAGQLESYQKSDKKIEFLYDALGRTYGIKKWKSSDTYTLEVKAFDFLDRVVEERIEDASGQVLFKKKCVYDGAGRITQIISYPEDKESILELYEYDSFGRLKKIIDGAGNATTIKYNDVCISDWGQKTRKRVLIDPTGNQTGELYDASDNLIASTRKDSSGAILAHSEWAYDCLGNKTSEKVSVLSAGKFIRTFETAWEYNGSDQLTSLTIGKGTEKERTTHFEYNTLGLLSAKFIPGSTDPIRYQYNNIGRLEFVSYIENGKEYRFYLKYDKYNRLVSIRRSSELDLYYTYDSNNQLLEESIKDKFGTYRISRTYDGEGKIKTLVFPDGSSVQYFYDGPFVKSLTRFSKEKKELYSYQVASRDRMGNILNEILPRSLGERIQNWDESGRRIAIVTDFFQDKILKGGYDSLSNMTKREISFEEEPIEIEYQYNSLNQLITEKSDLADSFTYDSIGNRLQMNNFSYTINQLNQLIEGKGKVYSYDENGNISSKKSGDKIWIYTNNALNQIVSVLDPENNIISYTYDLSGRRLSKCVASQERKSKVFRFMYLGDTEIGSLDENGSIVELKIPIDPNHPESPCVAIELKQEPFVPIYDLQGNIASLLDMKKRRTVESYRYSAYGEEEIINEKGRVVFDSSLGNPWRYRGKRVDKETGLISFGYRYYDPEIGRWVSPDPIGSLDGPNLYAFVHNNPLKFVDYFGLASEGNANISCQCGFCLRNEGCHCLNGIDNPSCVCKGIMCNHKWDRVYSRLKGTCHGVVDFSIGSLHDFQTSALYMGIGDELDLNERFQIINDVEERQTAQLAYVEDFMMDLLGVDESDEVYLSFRSRTTTTLEIGSLVIGVYGIIKGVLGFRKIIKAPYKISQLYKSSQAAFEEYKMILRSRMCKPHVSDIELQKLVNINYRRNAKIGSGSTAAAIRHERMTRKAVGGKFHTQKGREQIRSLERWLKQNPHASPGDRAAAENIIKDLQNALSE